MPLVPTCAHFTPERFPVAGETARRRRRRRALGTRKKRVEELSSSTPRDYRETLERLETVTRVELDGPASNTGDALVEEVPGENITAHAGDAVFAAAKVGVIKGVERFHPEEEGLPLADFEFPLN